jgi:hypothetical protein
VSLGFCPRRPAQGCQHDGRGALAPRPLARWRAGLLFWFTALWPGAAVSAEPIALRWLPEARPPAVEVTGLPPSALRALDSADLAPEAWGALLAVYPEQPDAGAARGMPPMAGTWRVAGDRIRFEPRFPFSRAVRYRAELRPARLPGGAPDAPPVVSHFELPTAAVPTTRLTHVHPSVDVLPENQLKFYLQFSAPMSGGGVYEHIRLRDSRGRELDRPFLELDEELWDPGMTRLTLLIDPGRIKRGVKPHEDGGALFEAGESYTLTIDPAWRDAGGQPLRAGFSKTYRITAADRTPPDTARWIIRAPRSATREPLVVDFDEPMDHALALRLMSVQARGRTVNGEASLAEEDRRWLFVPGRPWRSGTHRVQVAATIEDLAGNNIGKAFDVNLESGAPRGLLAKSVSVPFEVE